MRRLALCLIMLAPLAAAAQVYTYLDQSLRNGARAGTALMIAPDVSVSEISAGGVVEKMPDWSKQARENVSAALQRLGQGPGLRLAALPALSAEEQHALEQHVALYNVVAANVHSNSVSGGELWEKRLKSGLTDYTVGPGLAFLADRTGAGTALVMIARRRVLGRAQGDVRARRDVRRRHPPGTELRGRRPGRPAQRPRAVAELR